MSLSTQLMQHVGAVSRKTRRPAIPFQTKVKPFQIAPFFMHPVLPGETLKKAMLQAKCLSAPLASDMVGCHAELYWFYVKLTDLDEREKLKQMVVDPTYDAVAAGLTTTTPNLWTFCNAGVGNPAIDFGQMCLDRVVSVYFRNEDQQPGDFMLGGQYAARVLRESSIQSIMLATDLASADVDVDLDGDGTITAQEVENAHAQWLSLVTNGLTEKSYADWCKSYGITLAREELHEPENIRYMREWTAPTRLVDPSTGAPTAAYAWNLQESLDKDRFFKEPGFLFGVQVFRPKIIIGNYTGGLSNFLADGMSWLPGEVLNSAAYGLREFAAGTGPVPAATGAYVIDLRDLLMYGEQFVNFDLSTDGENVVALPAADMSVKDYVSAADVTALFAGANEYIRTEGQITLNILSQLQGDVTERT